jgi:hypothetical protein
MSKLKSKLIYYFGEFLSYSCAEYILLGLPLGVYYYFLREISLIRQAIYCNLNQGVSNSYTGCVKFSKIEAATANGQFFGLLILVVVVLLYRRYHYMDLTADKNQPRTLAQYKISTITLCWSCFWIFQVILLQNFKLVTQILMFLETYGQVIFLLSGLLYLFINLDHILAFFKK